MKIMICDSDTVCAQELQRVAERFMTEHKIEYSADIFTDGASAEQSEHEYDVAILEIADGKTDGISLAKKLKEKSGRCIFIFTADSGKYIDSALDECAHRFFVKPVDNERLYNGLESAIKRINENYADIYFNCGHVKRLVHAENIIYIYSENRSLFVVTTSDTFRTSTGFDDIIKQIGFRSFCKTHKSYLVNLDYATEYSYNKLKMTNGVCVPVSTRKQSEFNKIWQNYNNYNNKE